MPPVKKKFFSKVIEIKHLTDHTFILRFERHDLSFHPGQYISIGASGLKEMRAYSIFSPESAPYLEVLIKEVEAGFVSRTLKCLKPGSELVVDGPFGHFSLAPDSTKTPLLFIATGTGISPFRCFVQSYEDLDYTLLHGVRHTDEQYRYDDFDRKRVRSCVSRMPGGDFEGRITEYLKDLPVAPQTHCFLCGNCEMIHDAYDLLKKKGIPTSQIHTEVYF